MPSSALGGTGETWRLWPPSAPTPCSSTPGSLPVMGLLFNTLTRTLHCSWDSVSSGRPLSLHLAKLFLRQHVRHCRATGCRQSLQWG